MFSKQVGESFYNYPKRFDKLAISALHMKITIYYKLNILVTISFYVYFKFSF